MSVDEGGSGAGRSAGSDLFRGVLVIIAAVAVGLLLLSRGLADDDTATFGDGPRSAEADGGDGGEGAAPPPAEGEGEGEGEVATATTEPPVTSTTVPGVRQPSEVRVLVLNGSGKSGEAGRGAQFFTQAGYVAADPQNAPSNGPSAIFHAEGFEAEAQAAAAALGVDPAAFVKPIDPAAPPIADLQDVDLVVVAGTDGAIAF